MRLFARVPVAAVPPDSIGRRLPLRLGENYIPMTIESVEVDGDTAVVEVELVDSALCWEYLDPDSAYAGASPYRHPDTIEGTVWVARLEADPPT